MVSVLMEMWLIITNKSNEFVQFPSTFALQVLKPVVIMFGASIQMRVFVCYSGVD